MTFPPDDEYGDLLRRALRAEADSVVPSPDGLDVIRRRIDERGTRGLRGFRNLGWWRIGASAAGAVLVAGAVVLLVPDLRDQVAESTGITAAGADRDQEQDTSTVTRPPNALPPLPTVPAQSPAHSEHPSPSVTPHRPGPPQKPSPSPSAANPCATPAPRNGIVEPDPTLPATCPPAQAQQPAAPGTLYTPKPKPRPSASPVPSASPSPSPTPTPSGTNSGAPLSDTVVSTPSS
ncbi:hypothetical protein JOL79_02600 [Microbispora sp. RL4-1S]|uniref:Uncharacterized protein n=1 Tax=Microbispora oryzae TaxID=2806554 RepID=A0A941ANG3_9ACTN|nr:hypothetical protein [Microbispora oryzae]MBP2702689.1 hypothetical protein [Microbispora oryzae]